MSAGELLMFALILSLSAVVIVVHVFDARRTTKVGGR